MHMRGKTICEFTVIIWDAAFMAEMLHLLYRYRYCCAVAAIYNTRSDPQIRQ